MATLNEIRQRFLTAKNDLPKTIETVVLNEQQTIVELVKDQLYSGVDGEGNYLSPKYSEDTFFKTKDKAVRYSAWKDTLNQRNQSPLFSKRPSDVPNLIVNGKLVYNRMSLNLSGRSFGIYINSGTYSSIISKYGEKILILNKKSVDYFKTNYLDEIVSKTTKDTLYGL